jgi:hypothetical protein
MANLGGTRISGRLRTGGALAFVLVIVLAGTAIGAGLKTKSKTVTVSGDSTTGATAKCKQHQVVISGGFQAEHSDDVFILPHTAKSKGARKYTTLASNVTDESGTWTAFAYCRAGERLDKREASVTIPGSTFPIAETGSATAKCKRGTKVVSGGFEGQAVNGANVQPYESRKEGGRKWTVSAGNYDESSGTLTAYAFCGDEAGLKTKSASITKVVQSPGTVSAKCEKGQRVISGGFDNPDFGTDFFSDPQVTPYTSMRAGKRKWTVSAFAFGFGGGTLTAYAYCEQK